MNFEFSLNQLKKKKIKLIIGFDIPQLYERHLIQVLSKINDEAGQDNTFPHAVVTIWRETKPEMNRLIWCLNIPIKKDTLKILMTKKNSLWILNTFNKGGHQKSSVLFSFPAFHDLNWFTNKEKMRDPWKHFKDFSYHRLTRKGCSRPCIICSSRKTLRTSSLSMHFCLFIYFMAYIFLVSLFCTMHT